MNRRRSQTQSNGSDDVIIKTERRELVQVPVFAHELDSIGQMNKFEGLALNVLFTAVGAALGSAAGAFGDGATSQGHSNTISLVIFWASIAVGFVSGVFALASWLMNRHTKNDIKSGGQ